MRKPDDNQTKWQKLTLEARAALNLLGFRIVLKEATEEEKKPVPLPRRAETLTQPLLSHQQKAGYHVQLGFISRLQQFFASEEKYEQIPNHIKTELKEFFADHPELLPGIAKAQLNSLQLFCEQELNDPHWQSLNTDYLYQTGAETKKINPHAMLMSTQTLINAALNVENKSNSSVGNPLQYSQAINQTYSEIPKEIVIEIISKPEETTEIKKIAGLTCMCSGPRLAAGGGFTLARTLGIVTGSAAVFAFLTGLGIFWLIYKSDQKNKQIAKHKVTKLQASITLSHWLISQRQTQTPTPSTSTTPTPEV